MKSARLSLAVLATLFFFTQSAVPQGTKKSTLPAAVDTIFLPTEPGLIKYQPAEYEGRYLRMMDMFGEKMDENLLGKAAIKKGYDPQTYFIFNTSHETSEMRCYVERADKRDLDIAQNLTKNAQITLYGKLAWIEQKRYGGPTLHFEVYRIERGWDVKPVLTIELSSDKYPRKLYRVWEPKTYELVYPPGKTKQDDQQNAFLVDFAYKLGEEKKGKAGARDEVKGKTYTAVDSGRIPYDPKSYVSQNLVIQDTFDKMLTARDFSKEAQKVGLKPANYILFKTPSSGNGADLCCYVDRSEVFYCDLVEALVKNVKIKLYGTLVSYEELNPLRFKHFKVDRVDVGWEDKPAIDVRFHPVKGPEEKKFRFYKPYGYLIGMPPWVKTPKFDMVMKCFY